MQEIICILDKSGSMATCADDAIGGFRKFIEDQKKIGDCNLTVVWFDDTYELAYEGPLSKYEPPPTWPIQGMTALYDAIGKTFNHVNPRFEKEKPEKVIMAILTDGYENASKEFKAETIKDLITHHQNNYGWEVIFLAADQDAWATGQLLGIKMDKAVSYNSNDTRSGFAMYSNLVAEART